MEILSDMIEEVKLIAGIGRMLEDISQLGQCVFRIQIRIKNSYPLDP